MGILSVEILDNRLRKSVEILLDFGECKAHLQTSFLGNLGKHAVKDLKVFSVCVQKRKEK